MRAYLEKRRILRSTAVKFGMGAAPDRWDALLTAMTAKGYSKTELLTAGLAVQGKGGHLYDKIRNRLMLPVVDVRGDVVAFGSRVLDHSEPKYMNSPETPVYSEPVTEKELESILEGQLENLKDSGTKAQIAFFGGSFTAIDRDYMIRLLTVAKRYTDAYPEQYDGIRCSTRPDCIDEEILGILKSYGMTAIELGAQSMNDEVLTANRRGHTAEDVRRASRLIKQSGFELGLQMMTGLYKDTEQYCIDTAKEFIALHCDTVRIYPTVILKNTELGRLHESGMYDSFTFEQTTRLCARLLDMFNKAGVAVIRMGLHASRDVEQEMIGGVYHPALREIAESILYLEKMNAVCEDGGKYVFYTDKRNISKIIGQGGANRNALSQRGISFKIKEEKGTDLRAERIG